jgi:hypothetical protein
MPKEFQTLLANVPFKVGNFAHRLSERNTNLCVDKIAKVQQDSFKDQEGLLIR